jgi:hypothetical protein
MRSNETSLSIGPRSVSVHPPNPAVIASFSERL